MPLDGVRVLEVGGGIAAAYCCRLLRGFGAEVIRWESPGEENVLTADETTYLVAGKLRVDGARVRLDTLAESVDVVVEDRTPGWLAGNGVDPVRFRAEDPSRIVVSISPFGQTGPRAEWQTTNAVQFAAGGLMSLTGRPELPPLVTGGSQAFYLGGLQAFAAATALIYDRSRGGPGDWLDISLQECAASMPELYGAMSAYELDDEPVVRAGNSIRAVWGVYHAADGWAGVCCLERQVPAFFRLLGDVVAGDPRFVDREQRADHDDELLAHVMVFMAEHTQAELLALSPEHRVPFGAVVTPGDLLEDEGLRERGFFDSVSTADGVAEIPGRLFPGVGWRPPERLHEPAEDTDSVLRLAPRPAAPPPSPPRRPLEGVRVADLTMMWAGPYATKLLAELGAEVIKIESPNAWDNIRTLVPQEPPVPDPWNSAYYFNEYNHSKKSLTLDLATDEGREVFLDLVPRCDVVIENYRADVLDKLGLGHEVLRGARSDIVLVTMAGFGKTGPLARHVGFGPIIEMMSGLVSLSGYGDGEPVKTGISYGDPVGGLAAFGATMLGLLHRDRAGEGCHIDLAQRESAASMAGEAFAAASLRGEPPVHRGNRDDRWVPQGCYRSAGDDQWVVISVRNDEEWARLADHIGRSDLAGLSFAERVARHDELDAAIESWTAGLDQQDAAVALQALGVPAAPVLDTVQIRRDPQLVDRGFYVEVPNPKMRPYLQTGPTWRLVDSPPHTMVRSPWFGEHNREILMGLLGLTDEELAVLEAATVIGSAPVNPTAG